MTLNSRKFYLVTHLVDTNKHNILLLTELACYVVRLNNKGQDIA